MFCSILSRITFSSRLKWFFQWKIFKISWKWCRNGVKYFQICTYLHDILSHWKLCRKFNQNLLNLSQSFFLPFSSSKVHICQRKYVENQSEAGFFVCCITILCQSFAHWRGLAPYVYSFLTSSQNWNSKLLLHFYWNSEKA